MTHLSLSLLGSPRILIDGVPLKPPTIHAVPLLAYLSIESTAHTREKIASLLWSDSNLSHALAALRTTLWRMRSAGLDKWLTIDRDQISLSSKHSIEVDVLDFMKMVDRYKSHGHPITQVCLFCVPNLSEAVGLYRGEFLSGVNLPKAQIFEEWRIQQGEELHAFYVNVLARLVKGHRMLGDFSQSIQYALMLLREDQYNEAAQSDLMQLYSITGQRSAAISQYNRYRDLLLRELGLQPSPEITDLYKQILVGVDTPQNVRKDNNPIFLLANIENVSMLWEQIGDKKARVLSIYQDIFKETAVRFGGYVLQKSEDNITLLFERGQPLHCAVTIFLKIKNADWGLSSPPGVRMVVYSAVANNSSESDFTTITHSASKLLSMTWGGQVIFTENTLKAIEQPPGSRMRDLGYYSLRDSKPSVHIYELLHPHIPPSEHLTLRSATSRLVNFPGFFPEFIGREAELIELTKLLQLPDARLITLIGPGGVGKTRLAVQYAQQDPDRLPDGAYFIPLASIEDPKLLPIAVAEALNFRFYGTENQDEQLANYLHHSNTLLVFDNFEHLRNNGTEFIAYLLSNTHDLKILVTSRERLNLLSESILEINGLPVPSSDNVNDITGYSSITLFLRSAKRIYSNFDEQVNMPAIIRICRLLNGIPLGIILASSWVRLYTGQQIAEEIEKDLDFLSGSAVDLPLRHRSLRVVLDNSWKLLSNEERLILGRLSIFPASFSLQAANEICGASSTLLSSLIDKSLLIHQDGRFKMLDTFHQYSTSKLEAMGDERPAIRNKFIVYFSDFCVRKNQELSSSKQRQALDEMIMDFENIHSAWNWMIESNRWDMVYKIRQPLLTYHIITGNFIQGRELFDRALDKLEASDDPSLLLIKTSILMIDAWLMVRNGFITRGLQILTSCLGTFQDHHSPWNIIMSQMFIAESDRLQGNFLHGKRSILDALNGFETGGFPTNNEAIAIHGNCQTILGNLNFELGEFDQAKINLQAGLATQQKIGAYWGSIHPLLGLGKLAFSQGDFIQARDLYLGALETAEKMYDPRGMAMIHNNIGAVYEVIVNPAESYNHLMNALNYCKETGDRRLTAMILSNLAFHHMRFLSNYSDAIHFYHECIQIFIELGNLRGVAYSYYDISKAYIKVGLLHEGWEYCSRSLQTSMTLDSIPMVLHSLHGFINFFVSTGESERAFRLCCLIDSQPQVGQDTRKRVIVSRSMLELELSPEVINAALRWGETADLQDVIDQILMETRY